MVQQLPQQHQQQMVHPLQQLSSNAMSSADVQHIVVGSQSYFTLEQGEKLPNCMLKFSCSVLTLLQ
jgi:hypothetical protein